MAQPKEKIIMNEDTRISILENNLGYIADSLKEIKSDIKNTKLEVKEAANEIRSEVKLFKSEIKEITNEIRLDLKNFKIEARESIKEIRADVKRSEEKINDNFRWTMGVMVTLFSGLYATALGGIIARVCQWI